MRTKLNRSKWIKIILPVYIKLSSQTLVVLGSIGVSRVRFWYLGCSSRHFYHCFHLTINSDVTISHSCFVSISVIENFDSENDDQVMKHKFETK